MHGRPKILPQIRGFQVGHRLEILPTGPGEEMSLLPHGGWEGVTREVTTQP